MNKKILSGFAPSKILHGDDKSVKLKMDSIPGFKSFMMDVICPLREKMASIQYMGDGIRVSEKMIPHVYELLHHTCEILGIKQVPRLSMMWLNAVTAATEGAKNPHIVISSGSIDLLNDDEQMFLFGHELGHQVCGHKPYHLFLEGLFSPIIDTIPGGEKWATLAQTSLLPWYRISDFTADRVGLLACQDINVALQVIIKMSGIPMKYYDSINIPAFIQQAEEFDNMTTSIVENKIKYLMLKAESHPWNVSRAAELLKWYQSGEYEKIIQNKNA